MGYSVNPDCEVVVVSESRDDVDDDRKRRDVPAKVHRGRDISNPWCELVVDGEMGFLEPRP